MTQKIDKSKIEDTIKTKITFSIVCITVLTILFLISFSLSVIWMIWSQNINYFLLFILLIDILIISLIFVISKRYSKLKIELENFTNSTTKNFNH